jgi:hypothetical protein
MADLLESSFWVREILKKSEGTLVFIPGPLFKEFCKKLEANVQEYYFGQKKEQNFIKVNSGLFFSRTPSFRSHQKSNKNFTEKSDALDKKNPLRIFIRDTVKSIEKILDVALPIFELPSL